MKNNNLKAVQTVWTAGRSMTENSFGWHSPQAGLMSWALSSHCLSENFERVELYTDSEGARVLIDKLKLPYTEVHICYENLECHPTHWACSKIMTYSKQDEPFVHIDGDLYLPKGLGGYENSGLITQNEEIGSAYYKGMMNHILERGVKLPEYIMPELSKEAIGSYNAGVMGGCDISFIHNYCEEALKIIRDNGWDDPRCASPDLNNNLLFEQLLFYVLVKRHGKKVDTVINAILGDNKYSYDMVCNMMWFDQRPLFHLLGGFKRNARVCGMMGRTLLRKHPETYVRVLDLFGRDNRRFCAPGPTRLPRMDVAQYVEEYQRFVNGWAVKWESTDTQSLCETDRRASDYMPFFTSSPDGRMQMKIGSRKEMQVFSFPGEWPEEARLMIKSRLNDVSAYRFSHIALYPTLSGSGYREVLLNDLQYNIIEYAKEPVAYKFLLEKLEPCFSEEIKRRKDCKAVVYKEMETMFYNGLLRIVA